MSRFSQPLPYTASPYLLALADILLWARITFVWPPSAGIPSIILPILPYRSGALDELYPTPANLNSLISQLVFTLVQTFFILSIPVAATLGVGFPLLPPVVGAYVPIWLTWILGYVLVNRLLSNLLLNGHQREFTSRAPLSVADVEVHRDEKWVFVNGVAAGSHWMQSNLDRISLAFRREVHGIHNPTRGVLFDLMECILERTFSYPTPSTRIVYQRLLEIISDEQYQKVILILHSQGAIEGGLALDWLFATIPGAQLNKVEVYTFGSAANHFNNPIAIAMDKSGNRVDVEELATTQQGRILRHIEHYANSGDYVARFGILNFRPLPPGMMGWRHRGTMHVYDPNMRQEIENRYVGRLFLRKGTGHQLNGNYLDDFFPMNKALTETLDSNEFMDGILDQRLLDVNDIVAMEGVNFNVPAKTRLITPRLDKSASNGTAIQGLRAKDVSRLFMYRNGMSPVA